MQTIRERRRPLLVRTEVRLPATLLQEGQPNIDVRLMNLSPAGFMAECLEPVAPGTNLVLSVPGVGSLPAEIRWNHDFKLGGLFHFELSTRELRLIENADAEFAGAGTATAG
ncbi:MAG TPA: PilZ domain-containing protein [Allosphingosinicella sp.]